MRTTFFEPQTGQVGAAREDFFSFEVPEVLVPMLTAAVDGAVLGPSGLIYRESQCFHNLLSRIELDLRRHRFAAVA